MSSPQQPPDVVGLTEFAMLAGVERSTVSKWMTRGVIPPLPPATRLAAGPVWRRQHVVAWVAARLRQPS